MHNPAYGCLGMATSLLPALCSCQSLLTVVSLSRHIVCLNPVAFEVRLFVYVPFHFFPCSLLCVVPAASAVAIAMLVVWSPMQVSSRRAHGLTAPHSSHRAAQMTMTHTMPMHSSVASPTVPATTARRSLIIARPHFRAVLLFIVQPPRKLPHPGIGVARMKEVFTLIHVYP